MPEKTFKPFRVFLVCSNCKHVSPVEGIIFEFHKGKEMWMVQCSSCEKNIEVPRDVAEVIQRIHAIKLLPPAEVHEWHKSDSVTLRDYLELKKKGELPSGPICFNDMFKEGDDVAQEDDT